MYESQDVCRKVQQVVKKANDILAFTVRRLEFKNEDILLQLYRVLVRPQLECSVRGWS